MDAAAPARKRKRDDNAITLPYRRQNGMRDCASEPGSSHLLTQNPGNSFDEDGHPEGPTNSRPERRGHEYRHITTNDSARVQLGDTYIEHQHTDTRMAPSPEEIEVLRRKNFMNDLEFDVMDSRLAGISAAYRETCHWLFATEQYIRWRDPSHRASHDGFLWIKGKPGAGKSTLMKHALKYAQSIDGEDRMVLSYFFDARGLGLEKSTEGMYRSLLYQVFSKSPHRLPNPLPEHSQVWRKQGWPLPLLQDLLRDALLAFGNEGRFVFFVDALDECTENDIRLAIQYLEELGNMAQSQGIDFSVCFASRHYPKITIDRHETINLDHHAEHAKDISIFIEGKLRWTPMRQELAKEISLRCSGIFLWASLVVQLVNTETDRGATRSQLLRVLEAVPGGIRRLFETIMRNPNSSLLPTLQWVLFAGQTMSFRELYFAIKTSIGLLEPTLRDIDITTGDQMSTFITASSRGLVELTTHRIPRVQFIHETVREHLLHGGLVSLNASLRGNVEAISHSRLGRWCEDCIVYYARSPPVRARYLDAHRRRASASVPEPGRSFINYAVEQLCYHLNSAYMGREFELTSVDAVSWDDWISLKLPDRLHSWNTASPLYILLAHGCNDLAEAMLRRRLTALEASRQCYGRRMPHTGQDHSHITLMDVTARHGKRASTSLTIAIEKGFWYVVQLLLDCGANPGLVSDARTPLILAISVDGNDDNGIIALLLRNGARPNTEVAACTPIDVALSVQSTTAMKLLLDHGAHANSRKRRYGAPLTMAAETGQQEMVDLLLSHKADVNGQPRYRPLHSAVKSLETSIVRQLLTAGAQIEAEDDLGYTALHIIAASQIDQRNGRTSDEIKEQRHVRNEIASILLDAGADIHAVDSELNTALVMAHRRKRYSLARLLIDKGTNLTDPQHSAIALELQYPIEISDTMSDTSSNDSRNAVEGGGAGTVTADQGAEDVSEAPVQGQSLDLPTLRRRPAND